VKSIAGKYVVNDQTRKNRIAQKKVFGQEKIKVVFMEKDPSFLDTIHCLDVCRDTPWFPVERFQTEPEFRRSKFLLKNNLNSWIATINILNTNLITRVYNYN
jgi:hypothetical protein